MISMRLLTVGLRKTALGLGERILFPTSISFFIYVKNLYLQACKPDIKKYCKSVLQGIKDGSIPDGRGAVISCLKDNLDKVSVDCEDSLTTILEQEVMDLSLIHI